MKKIIVIFAIILSASLLFAACGVLQNSKAAYFAASESGNDNTTTDRLAEDIVNAVVSELKKENLAVSDGLVTALFDYYAWPYSPDTNPFFNQELRLLPSFTVGNPPDWEELTFFVKFYCANAGIGSAENRYLIPTAEFEGIVAKYFPRFDYEHRSSEYLTFTREGYVPSIHDSHGVVFYRLAEISQDGDVFTAAYEGFMIGESDFGSSLSELKEHPQGAKNIIAVMEHGNLQESPSYQAIRDEMRSLLLEAGYRDKLELYDRVTVSFQLSGNTDTPFVYLSCERIPPGTFSK